MNKREIFTFRGINQDTTKSKHPKEFYYEGRNIRVNATNSQSSGSITNEKGNKLVLTMPNPSVDTAKSTITYDNKTLKFAGINNEITNTYEGTTSGNQIIIGHAEARGYIVLFTTDDNGYDCIWRLDSNLELTLLYMRDLSFSKDTPIQTVFNYENSKIQKVYWVDGNSQLRFINVEHSKANGDPENLIDLRSNAIELVGSFDFKQPVVSSIERGGTHTSGMIQYAYNLYRVNGSQSKLSPLSELVPLAKENGGGEVNEIVGSTPVVRLYNLDTTYSNIRVYAIKYTSYNQLPSISLIKDEALNPISLTSGNYMTIRDNGNKINDLSLEEFLFLGSTTVSPKHIESKDNTLFLANIKETNFDIDIDTRAFAHDNTGKSVLSNGENDFIGKEVLSGFSYPRKFDAINKKPYTQLYQKDGVTLGGEGKHVKYELIPNSYLDIADIEDFKLFKSNEYYRLGLQFYNRLGQISFPKWIGDFIAPSTNLKNEYHTLKVTLKPEFYVWLNDSSNFETEDEKPVGYKILRADRTLNDRTVLCQGIINGMVSNVRLSDKDFESVTQKWEQGLKLPSLLRPFGDVIPNVSGVEESRLLSNAADKPDIEFWKDSKEDAKLADTYQFNKLMQLYTPEAMFEGVPLKGNLKVRVIGLIENYRTEYWNQIRSAETKEILRVERSSFGENKLTGDNAGDYGIFGPSVAGKEVTEMDFFQFYREYRKLRFPTTAKTYSINTPEITQRGQGSTFYGKHPSLNYYNSLTPLLTDSSLDGGSPITSVNSYGAPCLTFTIGNASMFNTSTGLNIDYDPFDLSADASANSALNLISMDKLYKDLSIDSPNSVLLVELYTDDFGGIYNGRSYEEVKRTNYIEIGEYSKIGIDNIEIKSPGDTFVNYFTFNKLGKTDTEVYSPTASQITEIVKFPVETTVDLRNRSDISLEGWDKRFQPRYDEFHDYNRVYSQEANLITRRDAEYTFKKVEEFDTKIMATKKKVSGEVIDSWTDLLVNEEILVDGKYGPITGLANFRDEIYSFQPKGVSHIAINPRVQTQGSDGVAVELGTGRLLHDYRYFSTNSGSSNKWGVIASEYGLYFVDILNKTLNRFTGKVEKLSDTKGLHTWSNNNLDFDKLKLDNPIKQGISMGYDPINHCILFTFKQDNGTTDTIVFNESTDSFTSFMDYTPSKYMKNNTGLFSLDPSNRKIYEHFKGDYNTFYDIKKPSYVTLMVNPNANMECVFNNIEYNSEIYIDDIEQSNESLTHIHAWNEYQDSGKIPLTIGRNSNLRRKFRKWRANIPRDGRNRMRNPWIYLKLELDNNDNKKMILHDIIVDYTIN